MALTERLAGNDTSGGDLVVVLGAGFSKAIDGAMPLTDDLGNMMGGRLSGPDQERLPPPQPRGEWFSGGRFEEWLSYLSEEQPHLSEDADLDARSLLVKVVHALREVLYETQLMVLGRDGPAWLYKLCSVLDVQGATVVSLNYDNLLECAAVSMKMDEEDILAGRPRLADAEKLRMAERRIDEVGIGGTGLDWMLKGQQPPQARFRLLKLHGSLSWYWMPGDVTGWTLQRWRLPGPFGAPVDWDDEERKRLLPGEPFIVPPAALKADQLHNLITREIWGQAYAALRTAQRVALVGYSLPTADSAMSGMVSDALRRRPAVAVEVVNRNLQDAEAVADRLARLGVPRSAIDVVAGVEPWVERQCDALASRLVEKLRQSASASELTGDEMLSVGGMVGEFVGHVVEPNRDGEVLLVLRENKSGFGLPDPAPLSQLLSYLGVARRLVAGRDGCSLPLVSWRLERQPQAAGYVHFGPAGKP